MAVFEFTITGKIEVDADALGVAVANSVRTKPDGLGEIDVDAGFPFRTNPTMAMQMLLQMGVMRIMNEKLPDTPWTPHALDAEVEQTSP